MDAKFLLSFVLVVNSVFCEQDIPCATPQGIPGTCVPQGQCKPLEEIIERTSFTSTKDKNDFIANWRCIHRTNSVCCPRGNVNEQHVLSVEHHKNYKLLPSLDICGISSADRLYSGNKTLPLEYPWMALIEIEKNERRGFSCGGTIISSRYILTAAHCITQLQKNVTVVGVRIGEHDLSTTQDCIAPDDCAPPAKDIAIEKIIPHPQFIRRVPFDTRNDIGLIRLAQAIDFDDDDEENSPICMPVTQEMREKNLDTLEMIVTGWGRTNIATDGEVLYNKNRNTDQLLQIVIPVASNELCEDTYRSFSVGQICAGGQKGIGTCLGDSGGPLMFHGPIPRPKQIKFVQYGVVSAGLDYCGLENKPTVFTSVAHHLDWILDQLEP